MMVDYESYVSQQSKTLKGYESGFQFDEIEKGEKLYVFFRKRVMDKPKFKKCEVIAKEKGKNAQGKDVIRNIYVKSEDGDKMMIWGNQIRKFIFKKKENEQLQFI